jgi:hypothetical protein
MLALTLQPDESLSVSPDVHVDIGREFPRSVAISLGEHRILVSSDTIEIDDIHIKIERVSQSGRIRLLVEAPKSRRIDPVSATTVPSVKTSSPSVLSPQSSSL